MQLSPTQPSLFYDPEAVRQAFDAALREGEACDCPTCGRHAQIYRRKFHASMAQQLIRLFHLGGVMGYVHASRLILPGVTGTGDFTKAKYWRLIEQAETTDDAVKSSGLWRLTQSGVLFVKSSMSIAREVMVFDDEVLGMSQETITIAEALGDRFNYQELMEARV